MGSEGTSTVKPIMDGRYMQVEMKGEMPGMGEFTGVGIYGFDNVSQKFVSIWIDNHSTGIMNGTGELSDDGKTITWNYTGNCPLTKKPIAIKDVETVTGPNTKVIESFGPDPKTGEVYQDDAHRDDKELVDRKGDNWMARRSARDCACRPAFSSSGSQNMSSVRLLVGTKKGAFILTSDGKRERWQVSGPHFAGWEIYHLKGSPVDPNRIYASQTSGWFGQIIQRSDDGGKTWHHAGKLRPRS